MNGLHEDGATKMALWAGGLGYSFRFSWGREKAQLLQLTALYEQSLDSRVSAHRVQGIG